MPATSPPATQGSKSIFTSRTFAGLALVAVPLIANKLGYQLDNADTQAIVEQVFQAVGLLLAAYGRLTATKVITATGAPAKSAAALLSALFLGISALYLTGCATTTRQGRVTNAVLLTAGKFAGKILISSVANAASQRAAGLQIDFAHSASAGLWANMDNVVSSADIERIVTAYAGPAAPALAVPLGAQFAAAQPRDAADRAAVVWALASGLDSAAARLAPSDGKGITPFAK